MREPIIYLQRKLAPAGNIRIGGEKEPRRPGRKLECFRLTTPREPLAEQIAQLYGGRVVPWESPDGPAFQVYTEASELPVLVMPGYSLKRRYEWWDGATKCMRLCDGVDEELSGGPCICNASGDDKCDLYTRLTVALPELDTALGWRLITRGVNAAVELPTGMALAEASAGAGQTFVRARLLLDQRRGVKDGQVVRYVVPVLDLPRGYSALAAAPPRPELEAPTAAAEPRTYTPLMSKSAGIDAALAAVSGPRSDAMGGNQPDLPAPGPEQFMAVPAPEPPADDGEPAPAAPLGPSEQIPVGTEHASADVPAPPLASDKPEQTKMATPQQKKKMDTLVGQLRDAGELQTDGLYKAVGERLRRMAGLDLAMSTPDYVDANGEIHQAIDMDGKTHWAPLRETLTRVEANWLIDRLQALERQVAAKQGSQEVIA